MADSTYMAGRKKYGRPQAMLWADNPGTMVLVDNKPFYVPLGNEINSDGGTVGDGEFIILSDDNREPINFKPTRIEKRERMINGRMRSYHIADKLTIDTSWSMVPSRSHSEIAFFDKTTGATQLRTAGNRELGDASSSNGITNTWTTNKTQQFTSDGGAGGVELLDWYDNHQGTFWVYLSYDKYTSFGRDSEDFNNFGTYSQVIEVYFADFSYSVEKRGGEYDFWNISVSLEEV
jgi:hypothetical protein